MAADGPPNRQAPCIAKPPHCGATHAPLLQAACPLLPPRRPAARALCRLPPPLTRRAERAKAKALKDKFKGATREDMAAAAPPGAGTSWAGGAQPSPSAGSASSARGAHDDAGAAARFGQLGLVGSPRPAGRVALPAQDVGEGEDEGEELACGGRSSSTTSTRPPAKVGGAAGRCTGAEASGFALVAPPQ